MVEISDELSEAVSSAEVVEIKAGSQVVIRLLAFRATVVQRKKNVRQDNSKLSFDL